MSRVSSGTNKPAEPCVTRRPPNTSEARLRREMGRRLKLVRKAVGMSQSGLAQTIGVAAVTVSAWELGRNQIDILKLAEAAKRHRFSTDWVILGTLSSLRQDIADRVQAIEVLSPENGRGRPTRPPAPPGCIDARPRSAPAVQNTGAGPVLTAGVLSDAGSHRRGPR
jgi:transcriptional regulator with XRE-family HTH domain